MVVSSPVVASPMASEPTSLGWNCFMDRMKRRAAMRIRRRSTSIRPSSLISSIRRSASRISLVLGKSVAVNLTPRIRAALFGGCKIVFSSGGQ